MQWLFIFFIFEVCLLHSSSFLNSFVCINSTFHFELASWIYCCFIEKRSTHIHHFSSLFVLGFWVCFDFWKSRKSYTNFVHGSMKDSGLHHKTTLYTAKRRSFNTFLTGNTPGIGKRPAESKIKKKEEEEKQTRDACKHWLIQTDSVLSSCLQLIRT